jgi:type IV secretion system protein TrbL
VTLAALFWSWGADDDIIARLVKKTLFVGVFAYIIGNWNNLARIVFESFAGLGLKASGTASPHRSPAPRQGRADRPRRRPAAARLHLDLMGYWSFFENFIQIACMLFAWALVLLAFFILAIQLFVTLIEFKLTTLAGFVLIPFGLFGKSAFMAERVLGNVISRHQGAGARRHHRHRLDAVLRVHRRFRRRDAVDRRRDGDRARRAVAARPRHLRPRHRQRPRLRRPAARRGRRRRHGPRRRRHGRGRRSAVAPSLRRRRPCRRRGRRRPWRGALAGGASTAYSLGAAGQSGASGVASGLGNVASTGAKAAVSPLKRAAGALPTA